ncbi:MAG: amidase [Candidatus Binatia bacterium]
MAFTEYADYDGVGLAELVRRGELTPEELAGEAIARIERSNEALNAVVCKLYERGRAVAARPGDGPFRGVPFLLKDILGNWAGVPTRAGSRFLAGAPAAAHDDTLVKRFLAAGLVPLGKTNVPEFGLLPTTESRLYGAARNPWRLDLSTGGSSGGSAAAVAAGMVPVAHANDGGGSIRIPASCCGVVGLKPSRARNPLGPLWGDIMSGLVVEHIVSRTVRDTAVMLDCTSGADIGDPYMVAPPERPFAAALDGLPGPLRIAFSTATLAGANVDAECVAAVEATAHLCAQLGHHVSEAAPPIDSHELTAAFLTMWYAGHAMSLDSVAAASGQALRESEVEGLTWGIYEQGRRITAAQYLTAVAAVQRAGRAVGAFHATYDCWLTSTLGAPPLRLGTIDIDERDPMVAFAPIINYVPFTPLQNLTGQPAISLPLHSTAEGVPVGVMFSARFGDEFTLLALAAQLERARPWRTRRPAVWS